MYSIRIIFLLFLLNSFLGNVLPTQAQNSTGHYIQWENLPDLPPAPGQQQQMGLAGAFSGFHNGALILAGGANFPKESSWNGGEKVWWDDIYILEKNDSGTFEWNTSNNFKLDQPIAYGVSISTPKGLICIGGNNAHSISDEVFYLKWNPEKKTIQKEALPALPKPLAFMAGAKVGNKVFVAGGLDANENPEATKHFFMLNLELEGKTGFQWEVLESWSGSPRMVPLSANQNNGVDDCFYLFSGRNVQAGKSSEILTDAYEYNPISKTWTQLPDIQLNGQKISVMAGTALATGTHHILIFGGDNGEIFSELEKISIELKKETDPGKLQSLNQKKIDLHQNHSGFSNKILAYHTITKSWEEIGKLPFSSHVTTNAIKTENGVIIPSGEISPGVRSPIIWKGNFNPLNESFGWMNYIVLILYLGILLLIGLHFSKKQKTTDDYFKGGQRVPWWAAGVSIFGTVLSAITFMAIPAKVYATDWSYFMYNMSIFLAIPIVVFLFIPFYRRLDVTTAYEYLEKRFNNLIRLFGSFSFILFQLGRIGVVLFLPSLALNVVTGIEVTTCILTMGIISVIYTMIGGIEAVIWTDVLQVFILMGGAIYCLFLVGFELMGTPISTTTLIIENHKINILNFKPGLTTTTFWVMLVGGFFANLISYGSDQTLVQRYLTTKDEKAAAKTAWINPFLVLIASILFFGMGTALYLFYTAFPERLNPVMENNDAVFPWFIISELPQGISGLLIAGVFSAAMSSLSSSMNSAATAFSTDFYLKFKKYTDIHQSLSVARWATFVIGVGGILFALWMSNSNIQSAWDEFLKVIGLFAGGLGGLFLLGIISKKANGTGAIIGLVLSGCIQFYVSNFTSIHVSLYTVTGFVSCLLIGHFASFLFPKSNKNIDGLTIYTLKKETETLEAV